MKKQNKKNALRKPSEVYQRCPACDTTSLIRLEVDVVCEECDWMSCEEHVECGGMDDLIGAFREHFSIGSELNLTEFVAQTEDEIMYPDALLTVEPIEIEDRFETQAIA